MSYRHKVPYMVNDKCLSHTFKYMGFYATHFHEGIKCYVVGALNLENGQVIARHYNEKETVNELLAKKESREAWEELKEGLERKPTAEESATDQALLEAWEESARRSKAMATKRSIDAGAIFRVDGHSKPN